MRPCKEIVEFLSSQSESSRNLPWAKRVEVRMHLLMCKHCSRYATHLKMMREGFGRLFTNITAVNKSEIDELEDKVLEKIKKKGTA